jgi:hypothetical protein
MAGMTLARHGPEGRSHAEAAATLRGESRRFLSIA